MLVLYFNQDKERAPNGEERRIEMFYVKYESLDYGVSVIAKFDNREEAEKFCEKEYAKLWNPAVESVWVSENE